MLPTLPKARNENIVVQELENEVLIYDFQTDKAFCLNETLSTIFGHCDGKTSFDELKRRYRYTDDLIYLALDELQSRNLVESEKITHFAGMSRREVIRKVGLGTMFALPVITGLVAPNAANAASCGVCNLPNATSTCVGGNCQITSCNPGFADCNNTAGDGCETNLNTSVNNCNGCGFVCSFPNATASCVGGSCAIASCNAGFANCNNVLADGCETNLNTSSTNCGQCGFSCPGGQTCQGGSCLPPP